ncbi:MAG: DUF2934 domain-containing protein [Nitrospirae bacterium]|nr:DUF2934 domain-containing protein [Nitrospirota bacterium]
MTMDKNMRGEIARVAYGLYEKRGCAAGNDFSDWIEAEKIVNRKYSKGLASDIKPVKPTQPHIAMQSAKSKSRGLFPRASAR